MKSVPRVSSTLPGRKRSRLFVPRDLALDLVTLAEQVIRKQGFHFARRESHSPFDNDHGYLLIGFR